MIGATIDITEDKPREQELAAVRAEIETTRENMRLVLENMHDGILLLDKDGRWRFGNAQYSRFVLMPPEIGKPGADVRDIVRFQVERGDFGPVDDVAKVVDERVRGAVHARRLRATSGRPRAATSSSSPSVRSPTAACSACSATSPS